MAIFGENENVNCLASISEIIIHHSATSRTALISDIRRIHVDERGWEDVGYHFVIEGDGKRKIGRRLPLMGAHCKGRNGGSIGICVVGNNLDPSKAWTFGQKRALVDLVKTLRIAMPWVAVSPHSAFSNTECPGLTNSQWDELAIEWR